MTMLGIDRQELQQLLLLLSNFYVVRRSWAKRFVKLLNFIELLTVTAYIFSLSKYSAL